LLDAGLAPVLSFGVSTTALGVILGSIVKNTGSILSSILFHFMVNFTGELLPPEPNAVIMKTAILLIIALGVVYHNLRTDREGKYGKDLPS
jgi:membrane protease YdiL (CAAX protease family)